MKKPTTDPSADKPLSSRKFHDVIHDLMGQIAEKFDEVHERFSQVDERFVQIDRRFEQVDKRFDKISATLKVMQGNIYDLRAILQYSAPGRHSRISKS